MSSYSIGISGLSAAQKALDIVGNNIANAATDGYHRQRIELTPAYASQIGSLFLGGGVDIAGVTRMVDNFIEQEILRQQSSLGQVSKELAMLRTIENLFGELTASDALSTTIDKFFNALQDLCTDPTEITWQSEVITAAETMAGQFRTLGQFLTGLESQITLEAENAIGRVNALINQIAGLNDDIEKIEIRGGKANNLCDQRDQCVIELSELIGIETQTREHGVVDVSIGPIPVVVGSTIIELEVGLDENNRLGISPAGASNYNTDMQGGQLGGLLSLKNKLISEIRDDLDNLAGVIIQEMNQYHVQGVGSSGSFTELTGWVNASEDLSDFSTVSAGYAYIRVTNTSSGAVSRTAIPVLQDDSSDTLTEIASFIDGADVANVSATVNSSNQLIILADEGYKFDFLPAVLPEPEPTPKTLTGTDPPIITVSGIYTGTTNSVFTCTVADGGAGDNKIGVTDGLKLQVSKDGEWVKDLYVGLGYAAGDRLDLGDGLYISLSIDVNNDKTAGDLRNGDNFAVKAWADTDTSGVLAAVGINTFFSGSSALDIAVCSNISSSPGRIATALGPDMTDNTNAQRMAGLKDESVSGLSGLTPGQFYHRLVTTIGQHVLVKQMREDNIAVVLKNLANQQSDISGVNINDEAAQMLVFEQMFQAMAKYLSTVQSLMSSLMELV